ncbi:Lrp/AsnC family transcriptional regulator [Thalassococcus sp. BH17M4-6]|uniref:Lrp/AsnC family transcriptional regulator n=1 Tax=Thalassococcus sp. BH17M4-6 TaxID=3413148 RepID=UPI003BEE4756
MLKLDARDMEILRVLSHRGRITKAELAEQVGLSPTPCWERLKKLETAGIIEGYGARLSLRAFGPHVVVFVACELEGHKAEHFQAFERAVQRYEEVTWAWALGGGFDYLLQVVTRDIDAYQRLIDALLEARVGLARYYTYIVTKPVKSSVGLPLGLLLDD